MRPAAGLNVLALSEMIHNAIGYDAATQNKVLAYQYHNITGECWTQLCLLYSLSNTNLCFFSLRKPETNRVGLDLSEQWTHVREAKNSKLKVTKKD